MVLGKLALTGPTGMVGSHLRKLLDQKGVTHMGASRLAGNATLPDLKHWDLAQWKSPDELDKIFPEATVLVHSGAAVPSRKKQISIQGLFDVNVRSCLCLAEWATKKNISILFLSGATVYDDAYGNGIKEDDRKTKGGFGGFYGYTKLLAEATLNYFVNDGLKLCILRPSSIYGFGLPLDKIIPRFLAAASRDETIKLSPPVSDRVNLIHASDVARAIVMALESQATGTYNIAGPESPSFLDIARTCTEMAGKGRVSVLETDDGRGGTRFNLDCSRAEHAFGFRAETSLRSGLEMMLKEMKECGQAK